MRTDTTERGLEELIVRSMTGRIDVLVPAHVATETSVPVAGGTGWLLGDADHYDREYCVDIVQLRGFLMATQEDLLESLQLQLDADGPTRRKFLARLQGEITKRGTIDVLRHGIKHGPHQIDLFYGTPSPGNEKAAERYARNRFRCSTTHRSNSSRSYSSSRTSSRGLICSMRTIARRRLNTDAEGPEAPDFNGQNTARSTTGAWKRVSTPLTVRSTTLSRRTFGF